MTAAAASNMLAAPLANGKRAAPAAPKPSIKHNYNSQSLQPKKIPRRSQPIIQWFQRKLAGTVKAKRDSASQTGMRNLAIPGRPINRITSSPLPSVVPAHVNRQQGRFDTVHGDRRNTISLNGDDDIPASSISDSGCSDDESIARGSTWTQSRVEADEDASVRPLPPSSPPSPSPSRSSSSYLSDPRTFQSIAASTKPTTLLSVDVHGGMAHIAEAPITPSSQITRFPHVRTSSTHTNPILSSGASITFSALPPSPQSSSRPSSTTTAPQNPITSVHAPLHTTHHPRNNPRPSSPPMDNASLLTLASSAYAIPGLRVGGLGTPMGWSSAPPSASGVGADSVSRFDGDYADAESQNDEEPLDDRDVDASLRALRPRSTRRGSWESEVSRWSARIQPSLVRERSVWTTNSLRTGVLGTDLVNGYEKSDEAANSPSAEEKSTVEDGSPSTTAPSEGLDSPASESNPHSIDQLNSEQPPKQEVSSDTVAQLVKSEAEKTSEPALAIPGTVDTADGLKKSAKEVKGQPSSTTVTVGDAE
ncbi:hypothetical protein GGU11DRAFT_762965 [Lentinula aff. detonsa]|uniref:Uncharacterized protein n=1 Tax=Lentinula aff. detonsa TaxID=2804958 RepID=A0AA38NSX1_9AGAR|nr:hypothetical protein GGU10DRAFT_340431 [Lentinula aff. detonsa]KAJ3803090.1 hypothetical protein GGU11DRAFT_762965 [Lentinula aff. detonsa]